MKMSMLNGNRRTLNGIIFNGYSIIIAISGVNSNNSITAWVSDAEFHTAVIILNVNEVTYKSNCSFIMVGTLSPADTLLLKDGARKKSSALSYWSRSIASITGLFVICEYIMRLKHRTVIGSDQSAKSPNSYC